MTRKTGILIAVLSLAAVGLLFVALIFFRIFVYEPFRVPSASMVPTLQPGQFIFVSKFAYGYSRYSLPFGIPLFGGRINFHEPARGDVVVFALPSDPSLDYVKRVVGLPGDSVRMKQGQLYINDRLVPRQPSDSCRVPGARPSVRNQPYVEIFSNGVHHCLLKAGDDRLFDNTELFHVPPGHYFVLGDNRDNSSDSRDPNGGVGYVPALNLVGRVEAIFLSPGTGVTWKAVE